MEVNKDEGRKSDVADSEVITEIDVSKIDPEELARTLNIKVEGVKFRHSVSDYSCDPKKKIIYKGFESGF